MGYHNIFNKGKNKNLPSSLTQTEATASQQASYFIAPLSRFTATKALLKTSCSPPENLSIVYWLSDFLWSLVLWFQHAFPALSPTSLLEECCASATPSLQWTSHPPVCFISCNHLWNAFLPPQSLLSKGLSFTSPTGFRYHFLLFLLLFCLAQCLVYISTWQYSGIRMNCVCILSTTNEDRRALLTWSWIIGSQMLFVRKRNPEFLKECLLDCSGFWHEGVKRVCLHFKKISNELFFCNIQYFPESKAEGASSFSSVWFSCGFNCPQGKRLSLMRKYQTQYTFYNT